MGGPNLQKALFNDLMLQILQASSSILIAIQYLSPPISSENEVLNLLISITQTPPAHLSLMTSSLQESVTIMMEDEVDKPENMSDKNSNTIKCGVSVEVVTMDMN
jgi:hypothetical protein